MSAAYDYPTDVTDEQWGLLQSLLPERVWRPGGHGRPPSYDVRHIVNGILYLNNLCEVLQNSCEIQYQGIKLT
jgi:hypothetical protein